MLGRRTRFARPVPALRRERIPIQVIFKVFVSINSKIKAGCSILQLITSFASKIGMFEFEKRVLGNGLRVVLTPMENTEAVTIQVLAGVGSRYETKKTNGISHFLEHMFFKGTKSRPKPGQVWRELDMIGATANAFTSKESTGFWVKSSKKDFGVSFDIVADILLEPLFNKDEMEREKKVILQEINMHEDDLQGKAVEVLENVVYGDQPVGWDIAGTAETVKGIKRKDIIEYKSRNYLSKNMVVAITGNIDKEAAFAKIEKVFNKVKKGKNKPVKKAKIIQKSPRVRFVNKKSDQTHFALAMRGYGMFDERRHALNLLSVILGGNFSSKLMMEIREKMGLAYYVYAWGDQYTDCGYLGMAAGVAHDKLETALDKIVNIVTRIKEKEVSKKDLDHAKSFLRGRTALSFESSDSLSSFAAERELFYNEIIQPDDILKKIEKVSRNDILMVARDIFRPNKINMAVIGRHENAKEKEDYYKKLFNKI